MKVITMRMKINISFMVSVLGSGKPFVLRFLFGLCQDVYFKKSIE